MARPRKDISKDIIALMKIINNELDTPLTERGFKWYYAASHNKSLNNIAMGVYDVILNSKDYNNRSVDDYTNETTGLIDVNSVIDRMGMGSEQAEYMWTLADVDNWIHNVLKSRGVV